MPYIYKIINNINDKIYIGKTTRTISERWKEHQKDYLRIEESKRPLYVAMRKYGIENFAIEQIEEVSIELLEEREKYWIEYFSSFKYGYNATIGGDGRPYIDYDLVVYTYRRIKNITETAKLLAIDSHSVSRILKAKNEDIVDTTTVVRNKVGKPVEQYDLNNNYLRTFPSLKNAAISIGAIKSPRDRGAAAHISDVCRGKRKTAYGFIWRFVE